LQPGGGEAEPDDLKNPDLSDAHPHHQLKAWGSWSYSGKAKMQQRALRLHPYTTRTNLAAKENPMRPNMRFMHMH
jgi:hypothetical protein